MMETTSFNDHRMNPPYICRPREGTSCGNCCNPFNYKDYSKKALSRLFRKRTEIFMGEWSENHINIAIEEYKKKVSINDYLKENAVSNEFWKEVDNAPLPFARGIGYNCDYLGFVSADEKKIGCLMHPKIIGNEIRESFVCSSFYCAHSSRQSYDAFKEKVLDNPEFEDIVSDWYSYSLIAPYLGGLFAIEFGSKLTKELVSLVDAMAVSPGQLYPIQHRGGFLSNEKFLTNASSDLIEAVSKRWS